MVVAEMILWAAALYAVLGLAVGVHFVLRGVQRVDAAAARASWSFRLVILPGSVALWPLIAALWIRGKSEGAR
jgi:hypothetical protein